MARLNRDVISKNYFETAYNTRILGNLILRETDLESPVGEGGTYNFEDGYVGASDLAIGAGVPIGSPNAKGTQSRVDDVYLGSTDTFIAPERDRFQRINKTTVSVEMNQTVSHPVKVDYDFLTFGNVDSYTEKIIKPAARINAELNESLTLQTLLATIANNALVNKIEGVGTIDTFDEFYRTVVKSRTILNKRKAQGERAVIVGSDVALVALDGLKNVAFSADGGDALREGTIGRVGGLLIVEHPDVPANFFGAFAKTSMVEVQLPLGKSLYAADSGRDAVSEGDAYGYYADFLQELRADGIEVGNVRGAKVLRPQHIVTTAA